MLVQTVALRKVKCFAYHGFYPEEHCTGNHFLVDITVKFFPDQDSENLDKTVNYEELNAIILEVMATRQLLLETVVKHLMDEVLKRFSFINFATVGIEKLHPPMLGEVGSSYVELHYER